MEIKRKSFQGVLNILSFNRHFYVFGLVALTLIITSHILFSWSNILYSIIFLSFIYGLIMPLIVSAYVYDFSGYYNFKWLKNLNIIDSKDNQILNINAGFDETSFIIKNLSRTSLICKRFDSEVLQPDDADMTKHSRER